MSTATSTTAKWSLPFVGFCLFLVVHLGGFVIAQQDPGKKGMLTQYCVELEGMSDFCAKDGHETPFGVCTTLQYVGEDIPDSVGANKLFTSDSFDYYNNRFKKKYCPHDPDFFKDVTKDNFCKGKSYRKITNTYTLRKCKRDADCTTTEENMKWEDCIDCFDDHEQCLVFSNEGWVGSPPAAALVEPTVIEDDSSSDDDDDDGNLDSFHAVLATFVIIIVTAAMGL
eukprot:TRINITY_DN2676_c0_g4_i2.p1 TRINITY_DN2676_c0_g4~~TRINITY_DN2676_c0_g4_i2.p1  ORF type:complete len:226 (-),score=45.90 TRINITY_DN2676_c0_g4_i2:711-1388(-)